jgi:hypothetical protein
VDTKVMASLFQLDPPSQETAGDRSGARFEPRLKTWEHRNF